MVIVMTEEKNLGGRPAKWETPEQLEDLCNQYFESCWEFVRDEDGNHKLNDKGQKNPVRQLKPYTVSGLAVFLGTNRMTLLNYQEKDGFFYTIKKAKAIIEAYVEERLFQGKATGPIFNLKNNFPGWKEKFELNTVNANLNADMAPEDVKEASRRYAELVRGDR